MHNETVLKLTNAAKNKINLLNKSKLKYLVSAAFAGLYVGLGIILIFTVGGLLSAVNSPATKIMMGVSFAVALCLVIMTGTELFTGNNMVMTVGRLNKGVSTGSMSKVWIFSFVGNLLGSILVAAFFVGTGLVNEGAVMEFFATTSIAKVSAPFMSLFFRGVLCNILVCVAVLFEHSAANMTIFSVALISPAIQGATLAGAIYNLVAVTLGNMVGGVLVMGLGVYIMGSEDKEEKISSIKAV